MYREGDEDEVENEERVIEAVQEIPGSDENVLRETTNCSAMLSGPSLSITLCTILFVPFSWMASCNGVTVGTNYIFRANNYGTFNWMN